MVIISSLVGYFVFQSDFSTEKEDVPVTLEEQQIVEEKPEEVVFTIVDEVIEVEEDLYIEPEEVFIEEETSAEVVEQVVISEEIVPQSISWWKPAVGISWQWQLSDSLDSSYDVDVYDIDLFDTTAGQITSLHAQGSKVLCYFSAGSYEDWRDDADEFPKSVLGKKLDGWAGERWLDVSEYDKFADIMLARLDLAVIKGCDGVEPDNVDSYTNNSGFSLSSKDQLIYNKFLAVETHKRGLAIALKNNLDQIPELLPYFDLAVNEQCFEYDECEMLTPFIHDGKPVLGVEYELSRTKFCLGAEKLQFSWLEMDYDLDGGRLSCDD